LKSLDNLFEDYATEKLGDWDAIICTTSRTSQKITAFDQAGDECHMRAPSAFALSGACNGFQRALKEARLFKEKSHKTELCRQLTN
jgi:hypothetical protein